MRVGDIISTRTPVVDADNSTRIALDTMTREGLDSIVVVKNHIYCGIATKQQCIENLDNDMAVGEIAKPLRAVQAQAHLLEAVSLLAERKDMPLAVVGADNSFVGCVTVCDLISAISTLTNASHRGVVIELEMFPEEFSAAEIARLIEDNHCKLITLFSYPDSATGLLHVQVRSNCEDASAILQSFERYGYRVLATYYPQGRIDERTEQRLRELMYYLEM